MFCEKCGTQLSDRASFCEKCGAPTSVYYTRLGREKYISQQAPIQQSVLQEAPKQSLKFHGFILVLLWIMAVISTIDGVGYLAESIWDNKYIFNTFAKVENILCGVVYLLIALLCVFTFFRLSSFKKNGPMFLLITFISQIVIVFLSIIIDYSTGFYSTAPDYYSGFNINYIVLPIAYIVFMILSIIYYKKRKALFNK